MPGGTPEAYQHIQKIVEKVAAQVNDGPCVTYIGPGMPKILHDTWACGSPHMSDNPLLW
jgi:6-phosphogluconate dehydrogenase